MTWDEKLQAIDRRIIFLLVGIAVALPIIFRLPIPIPVVTPEVMGVYERIEALPSNAGVFMVFDYEPATTPELNPMAEALLRHCFQKNLRVVCATLYSSAPGIMESLLKEVGDRYGKKAGIDYTLLGYRAGGYAVILRIVDNLKKGFPRDYYDNLTTEAPVLEGLDRLKDFAYLMCLHDDSTIQTWVTYGYERTGIPMASGCTAVMATGSYPLLHAKQINGILGGLKGAAEYEKCLNYEGVAHQGMFSQSVVHMLIIAMIVLGNVGHFLRHRRNRQARS
ncbi:MAG TPA: hypothetical protein PKH07_03520 [bacterium]|nr:hypothetical protein [bacterium]